MACKARSGGCWLRLRLVRLALLAFASAAIAAATPAVGQDAPANPQDAAAVATELSPARERKPAVVAPQSRVPAAVPRQHLPGALSPWGMFLAADIVVKGVMIFLATASVLVWTTWIAKQLQLVVAKGRLRRRLAELSGALSLPDAVNRLGSAREPAAVMAGEAMAEIGCSEDGGLSAVGIKERVGSRLARIEAAAGRAMNRGTGLLATVGGTAPFIGLFGTVWGILNSFIGISKAQTTNLAVVAPGIAEALLATAIGLVAAIPAVIFYNHLARSSAGYRAGLADVSAALMRIVSRDLDRRDFDPLARFAGLGVQHANGQRRAS